MLRWDFFVLALVLLLAAVVEGTIVADEGRSAAHPRQAGHGRGASAHYKSIAKSISDKIKHIVVLMMENRSFDHMFGFYGKGTNGLTGKEYNLVNTADPNSKRIYVDKKAPFINQCDPSHDATSTTRKIFGNLSRAEACDFTCESMGGFVETEGSLTASDNYCNVMESMDTEKSLPVMAALAENYVLMDRFFASMPGPTWPNRLFHLTATSAGLTETAPWYQDVPGKLFPQKSIFDQVNDVGGEWRVYYNDTPWEMFLETIAHHPEHLSTMTKFFADCQNGNLPDYAFINPRSGVNLTERVGSNDHHPDHDIRAGEQFYKDIYEAIRASPQWNETLFIITYDEHGGFHDHVLPPLNVPDPEDGIETYPDAGFKFNRLGIRVPTLLISPWVPKGHIVGRAPEAQRPFPNSEYDLTSIMASARKILKKLEGVPALTKRDAWASTFEHVLGMVDEPRTDCPLHLPIPQPPSKWDLSAEARQPVNGLQSEILAIHHSLAHPHDASSVHPHHIQQQSQVGDYLQDAFRAHKDRTLRWKAGKGKVATEVLKREGIAVHNTRAGFDLHMEEQRKKADGSIAAPVLNYTLQVAPFIFPGLIMSWDVVTNATVPWMTIHGMWYPGIDMCFDAGSMTLNQTVILTPCYPSSEPSLNTDKAQQWIVGNDATIRPYHAQHLCLTNDYFKVATAADSRVFLAACREEDVRQHYAYHRQAPGNMDLGVIYFGDTTTVLAALLL